VSNPQNVTINTIYNLPLHYDAIFFSEEKIEMLDIKYLKTSKFTNRDYVYYKLKLSILYSFILHICIIFKTKSVRLTVCKCKLVV